ncbi:MAG: nucleotide sugar dehydrogenase, partial [Roseibacillus sp.]|nr:nucleotide sugar dehydrogenase [Roseibacillus sp.]
MKLADQTLEKIENGSAVIGVVGLGYVGLPLILGFVGRGFRVMGIDIDRKKIEAIRAGES